MLKLTKQTRKQIKEAQQNYIEAKAQYEAIKQTQEENELKVLSNNIFLNEEGERVTKYSYRINEDQFEEFLKLVYVENKKAGLPVNGNIDFAIEYPYFQKMQKIEKELFELQLITIPEGMKEDIKKAQQSFKFRDKALDLILKLDI